MRSPVREGKQSCTIVGVTLFNQYRSRWNVGTDMQQHGMNVLFPLMLFPLMMSFRMALATRNLLFRPGQIPKPSLTDVAA
jgi:hypothetical protein